jgi:hypothetical protein
MGASTRQLNKKAVAEGEPPTHGVAGKAREKRAAKAALAAAPTAASPTASSSAPQEAAAVSVPVTSPAGSATPKAAGR